MSGTGTRGRIHQTSTPRPAHRALIGSLSGLDGDDLNVADPYVADPYVEVTGPV